MSLVVRNVFNVDLHNGMVWPKNLNLNNRSIWTLELIPIAWQVVNLVASIDLVWKITHICSRTLCVVFDFHLCANTHVFAILIPCLLVGNTFYEHVAYLPCIFLEFYGLICVH